MPSALPAVLFERYHVSVFRFFRRIIRDPDVAEDLTQELFLRVVRDADRSRPLHSEAAWVFRIARHVLADHVRAGQGGDYELSVADPENVGQEPGQLLAFGLREALDLL